MSQINFFFFVCFWLVAVLWNTFRASVMVLCNEKTNLNIKKKKTFAVLYV